MKKLLTVLSCAAMIFSLSACGSKVSDEALDAFEKAIINIADMKSADYAFEVKTEADDVKQIATLKGSYDVSTAEPKISIVLGMEQDGQKMDNYMSFYINTDTAYMNMMNISKTKMSLSSIMDQSKVPSSTLDKDTLKVPKDDLKKILKEASLKDDTLTLKFDTEKLLEMMEKKQAGSTDSLKDIKLDDLTIKMKLEKDMMTSADVNFDMSKTENGKTETAKMTASLTFKNINKVKEVVFPDFTEYTESEDGSLIGLE